MRVEQTYKWRIQWTKRWSTTNFHCTEEQIRKEHPEAIRVPGTLVEHQIPETEAEKLECLRVTSTGFLTNHNQYHAPHPFASSIDPNDVPF